MILAYLMACEQVWLLHSFLFFFFLLHLRVLIDKCAGVGFLLSACLSEIVFGLEDIIMKGSAMFFPYCCVLVGEVWSIR